MSNMEIDVPPDKLLAVIHNHINDRFFEKTKHDSKRLFLAIESGKEVPFMKFGNQESGDVSCTLTLDHSQFVGRLSFSAFRSALASHLNRTASKIQNKESLNIFTNDASCDMIFHIPGFVESGGKLNILVTGVRQKEAGNLTIRMMFLDPAQFATQSD